MPSSQRKVTITRVVKFDPESVEILTSLTEAIKELQGTQAEIGAEIQEGLKELKGILAVELVSEESEDIDDEETEGIILEVSSPWKEVVNEVS